MKIGFIVLRKDTFERKETGVWGDCIVANALCRAMQTKGIDCDLYNYDDEFDVDVAIYMTDIFFKESNQNHKKRYLWMQGFTYDTNNKVWPLDTYYDKVKGDYDKVFTASRVLSELKNIPFIYPGVDFSEYYELPVEKEYDITFIGNLIKPPSVTHRYISPMSRYNYGLFGGDFGKIGHHEGLEVISKSKINLHFGFEESIQWDMVTGRPFHISACKGFTLMDKVPFFMEYYKDAMGFTDGYDEGLISYYLQREREGMAREAYEITLKNFSSHVVAEKLLEVL